MERIQQVARQMESISNITISTHVLDTCNGVAASGKEVLVSRVVVCTDDETE